MRSRVHSRVDQTLTSDVHQTRKSISAVTYTDHDAKSSAEGSKRGRAAAKLSEAGNVSVSGYCATTANQKHKLNRTHSSIILAVDHDRKPLEAV